VPRLLLLLLEFVLLSVPLTWAWLEWGRAPYAQLIVAFKGPLLDALGIAAAGRGPTGTRYLSFVPFLVLMLITPGLSDRRRTLGTLVGFALIVLSHVVLAVVVDHAYATNRRNSRAIAEMFPAMLAADALPFLVWAVVAGPWLRSAFARKPDSEANPSS
jgi:hypothetical protein